MLWAAVGLVMEESFLFSDTVASNFVANPVSSITSASTGRRSANYRAKFCRTAA
jgi:hypothetical protein